MYAVIKTGGKQYRIQPGDLLVVEKLDGEPGAEVAFGDVLLLGDDEAITVGAPLVDGAKVSATLIETRKGEKVKIFKKIRRQGLSPHPRAPPVGNRPARHRDRRRRQVGQVGRQGRPDLEGPAGRSRPQPEERGRRTGSCGRSGQGRSSGQEGCAEEGRRQEV